MPETRASSLFAPLLACLLGVLGCADTEGPSTVAPSTGEAEGRACGSRGLAPCPAGYFCEFEPAADCGRGDRPGHCSARPEACDEPADVMCGCDGQTYESGCAANLAGVSVASAGACGGGSSACVRSGCGGEVCVEEGSEVTTPCVVTPEQLCFRDAVCERQASGTCGFTSTPEITACLERARAE